MIDRRLLAACAVFLLALLLPAFISGYGTRILNLALISAIAVIGLNFAFGYAGLITLAQAGFVGCGAYITAILSTTLGLSPWLSIPAAMVGAGVIAVVIGLPMLRLKGHYLALATLGFNVSFVIVATNWKSLMGGTDGISGIPGPWKAALGQNFNTVYFAIVVVLVGVVFAVMRRIDRSPYGRVLRAIREDAQVAQVAGKPVLRFKAEAFALSAAIAGLAGALYGHFTSYIAPDLFLPLITVYIFLAVASGGTGRPAGALLGAYLVMTLLESSRFFVELIPGVTAVQRAALKELLIAAALILVLRLKPSGVLPERIPPAPRPVPGGSS